MNLVLASLICSSSMLEEASSFLKKLHEEASSGAPGCAKCSQKAPDLRHNLMVFISFSVPLESWKEWSHALEKFGGTFVLKGIPDNSFQMFMKKIVELRRAGVNAPISIDPEAYEKFGVNTTPTVVALNGKEYDKVAGNIHLEAALRMFNEKGVTVTPFR